jgi:site-specific DNA recombinase
VSSDKQREKNTIASQTTALIDFARRRGHHVPDEWIFEDDGYSGATLIRPGLECVRDLAAEGQIHAVLVHAPDRLSRKYAYQVLLIEEFARHGVETIFLKAPQTATAEDQLLVQFQGMIAEYERAQILERSRRGKRHRAHQGQVSVLSGARRMAIVTSVGATMRLPITKSSRPKLMSSAWFTTTMLVED